MIKSFGIIYLATNIVNKKQYIGRHSNKTKEKLKHLRLQQKCPRMGKKHSKESKIKMALARPTRRHVTCITTGEIFVSASDASKYKDIPETTLYRHLKNKMPIKGLVFEYINQS